jgi:putative ABC transport system permease protein
VLGSIVLQAMKPVAVGIVAGLAISLLLSRFVESLLFGVTSRDPITYAAVASVLGLTALLACILPARRALRIDVVSALRAE